MHCLSASYQPGYSPQRVYLALVSVFLASTYPGPSLAHSWYPPKCCNEIDCFRVSRVQRELGGGMRMFTDHFEVGIPPGFQVLPSQDADAHVCVYRDLLGRYLPRCVFLPGTS